MERRGSARGRRDGGRDQSSSFAAGSTTPCCWAVLLAANQLWLLLPPGLCRLRYLTTAGDQGSRDHWWDLCAGPHVASTGDICPEALDLDTLAGGLAGLGWAALCSAAALWVVTAAMQVQVQARVPGIAGAGGCQSRTCQMRRAVGSMPSCQRSSSAPVFLCCRRILAG